MLILFTTSVCRSDEALFECIRVQIDSMKLATESALLQSIVLLQYFPELISSNHAREPLKVLSSLAKDTQLVGSGQKAENVFVHI